MTQMLDRYEIRGELGRGAMAVVWRGWDPRLEREVAIKEACIPASADAAMAAELGERFVREGRAVAALSHPGIVTIHAAEIVDGRPIIVMELVDGQTLSQLAATGPLPSETVVALLDQLLDAVGFAHARGIVHRDIKPDNVFVTADGRIKLADFGIAHVGGGTMTQAGTVMGTPGYMAPEQVTGGFADARSDLFAVGVIGYELLTGHNPFGANEGLPPTTIMYRLVHEEPAPLTDFDSVPPQFAATLAAALAKDPLERIQTAEQFRSALHGGSLPVHALPGLPVAASATSPSRRHTAIYWAVGAVGAVVIAGLVLAAMGGPKTGIGSPAPSGGAQVAVSTSAPSPQPGPISVQLVLTPAAGEAKVGERIAVVADVSDPARVSKVAFYVNKALVGTDDSAPFEYAFTAEAGRYDIQAKATGSDGSVHGSQTRSVVSQLPKPKPVTVSAPPSGADSPVDAVYAYYQACDEQDEAAAYSVFSSARRTRITPDEFHDKYFRFMGGATVRDASVSAEGPENAEVTIAVDVKGRGKSSWQTWYGTVSLVYEGGQWLIDELELSQ